MKTHTHVIIAEIQLKQIIDRCRFHANTEQRRNIISREFFPTQTLALHLFPF